jgi:type IV fimbrial biogenesis protein FimT
MQVLAAQTPRRINRSIARGLTLVELAIGLSITSILIGTAAPSLNDVIGRRGLEGMAAELAADIQFVRSEAVARQEGVRWTLHTVAGGTCAVIHTGAKADCQCGPSGEAVCTADAQMIKSRFYPAEKKLLVSTTSKSESIRVEPTHGMVSPTATIKVAQAGGASLHHVVNIMGRTRTCSPDGAVRGYKAC